MAPIREDRATEPVSNFKVFDHRIGYRSFGNDPDDVLRPRQYDPVSLLP